MTTGFRIGTACFANTMVEFDLDTGYWLAVNQVDFNDTFVPRSQRSADFSDWLIARAAGHGITLK